MSKLSSLCTACPLRCCFFPVCLFAVAVAATTLTKHLSVCFVCEYWQRFIESLGLVSLQGQTEGNEARGMAGVYIALAQALVCEQLDVDGGSGLRGWKQLCQENQEKTAAGGGGSKAPLPGKPVLEAFGEAVRRQVVGRARQLGAGQNCELPALSCAADAFNVQIHLLKIAGETFEETALYGLPAPLFSCRAFLVSSIAFATFLLLTGSFHLFQLSGNGRGGWRLCGRRRATRARGDTRRCLLRFCRQLCRRWRREKAVRCVQGGSCSDCL